MLPFSALWAPLLVLAGIFGLLPHLLIAIGRLIGISLRSKTQQRREILLRRALETETQRAGKQAATAQKTSSSTSLDDDWEKVNVHDKPSIKAARPEDQKTYDGVIGFFHPFCNAGGGGERVLFAAIHHTQQRYPKALCVVYTGDQDASKEQILTNVHNRFNITLEPARLEFMYLTARDWVLASKWPHFTLLGQSLGSILLAWDALSLMVPDIFIDTMGYAFALAFCKWLFPGMPTGAYVHYPTISTDMLSSLHDKNQERGLNAGSGTGVMGVVKQRYWELFAWLYSWVGGHIDIVMTNSTWTQRHITSLWSSARSKRNKKHPITLVYPPCAVEELLETIRVDETTERQRTQSLVYIAQFRPEKMHQNVISAFATFYKSLGPDTPKPKLILCGSVRDDQDEKRVYKLRLQAQQIKDHVEFVVNAKWPQIRELLRTSSIGVNGMWNEHFGIGVVEYQAAGLISVVNNSGGPKEDIVVDVDGEATGFHASTNDEYADAFGKALRLSQGDTIAMRKRARKNSLRFSEEAFGSRWITNLEFLIELERSR